MVATGSKIPFELACACFEDLGKATVQGDLKWHNALRVYLDSKAGGQPKSGESPMAPRRILDQ